MITSQLPVAHWHEALGDPTLADAILDRLVHHAHPIALTGESLRKAPGSLTLAAGVDSGPIDPGKAPSSVTAGP